MKNVHRHGAKPQPNTPRNHSNGVNESVLVEDNNNGVHVTHYTWHAYRYRCYSTRVAGTRAAGKACGVRKKEKKRNKEK